MVPRMPTPPVQDLCVGVDVTATQVCLTMPGGVSLCAQFPSLVPPSPDELISQLFAQLNAALAPLQPTFNLLDAILAIFSCIKAIATLDPKKIADCIPNLADKIAKILQLIPALSLPVLIVQFLDILILFLTGQRNQLTALLRYNTQILAAETAAQQPGNLALASVIECARADLDSVVRWLNASASPVNRLIGLVNLFLQTIGLGQFSIPSLEGANPEDLSGAIAAIDAAITGLEVVRAALAPLAGQVTGPFEAAAEALE
jgi:hypothetical protein